MPAGDLATAWTASVDGRPVSRGPLRNFLQWAQGAPRAGRQLVLTIPLHGATGQTVDITGLGAVSDVFLYGPDEAPVAASGEGAARDAAERARAGDWPGALARWSEAARLEPHRASYAAARARAQARVDSGAPRSLPDGTAVPARD